LNIDDTNSNTNTDDEAADPSRPWSKEWSAYINSNEVVPEGMGIVHWWGVSQSPLLLAQVVLTQFIIYRSMVNSTRLHL